MTDITFASFDKFQRKIFADRLTKVLTSFYPFYKEAFVLGLNARYGAGKTTFLTMWKDDLELQQYEVIYINAWETDFDNEPLIPIVGSLLDHIKKTKATKKIKEALQSALGAVALASNGILDHVTGVNVYEIGEAVEKDLSRSDLKKLGDDLYKEYSFKKNAYETLREELSSYVQNISKKPLIIFVDELDRVRPDYSVKFLEAIKHIFSVQGLCFVLAVDRIQLEISIKQLYGAIDFENYYRRFVTREAQLSEDYNIDLMPFLSTLGQDFFDEKRSQGLKFPFEKKDQARVLDFISNVCRAYRFLPRQIESLFRIFSQFMAVQSAQLANMAYVDASILLIAMYVHSPELYHKVGKNRMGAAEIYNHIGQLDYLYPPHNHNKRYFLYTAMAFCVQSSNEDELEEIAKLMSVYEGKTLVGEGYETAKRDILKNLTLIIDRFGSIPEKRHFTELYNRLEEWRPFI